MVKVEAGIGHKLELTGGNRQTVIKLDTEELAGRGLTEIVKVEVEGPDGRRAVVFLNAILNDRGQVEYQMTALKPQLEETKRSAVAHWVL